MDFFRKSGTAQYSLYGSEGPTGKWRTPNRGAIQQEKDWSRLEVSLPLPVDVCIESMCDLVFKQKTRLDLRETHAADDS